MVVHYLKLLATQTTTTFLLHSWRPNNTEKEITTDTMWFNCMATEKINYLFCRPGQFSARHFSDLHNTHHVIFHTRTISLPSFFRPDHFSSVIVSDLDNSPPVILHTLYDSPPVFHLTRTISLPSFFQTWTIPLPSFCIPGQYPFHFFRPGP